jgi:CMP/dCMP kinase
MKQRDANTILIIGGPGGSGSSTISEMLASHFKLPRIYAGDLFREKAKEEEFESFEQFLQEISDGGNSLDLEIDNLLMEYAKQGNIIIESKVFGPLAKIRGIEYTASIWLESDLNTKVKRKLNKENVKGLKKFFRGLEIKRALKRRYKIDREKYQRLYAVDYTNPRRYYDIVLNTSKLNEEETFKLILERLSDGGYIKQDAS